MWTFADAKDCPPDAPRSAPHAITGETCPRIGRIGSLKLAVPQHYILGPDFVYEGVDIWNAESYKNRPKEDSFDLPIKYFSIRIRLNNFKPVETQKDIEDFDAFMKAAVTLPSPENQWIFVQFHPYPSLSKKENRSVDMQASLNGFIHFGGSRKPPLEKQIEDVRGLKHYLSPVAPSTNTTAGEVNEVFYDAAENQRLMYCSNYLRYVEPHNFQSSCHYLFNTNNRDVSVRIDMIRDKDSFLSRWKEIEKGVQDVFDSFIVQ
jgi:hypothetical protein